MFVRESLKTYTSCELYYKASDEFKVGEAYLKDEADSVMDAMERRIARLTALVEGWKRNSVELGKAYHKRLAMEQERNKELEAENERLKAENAKLKDTEWMSVNEIAAINRIDELGVENERLKAKLESQDHIAHNREMVSPNKNNIYNPLKMFYEIAEKYFATSTPQDLENAIKEQRETNVIVHKDFIEHLRKENERLDGEVNRLEATNESLADEQVKILDERDELRKENAKLRCLTLHLFERVARTEASEWSEFYECAMFNTKSHLYKQHEERWLRIAEKCSEERSELKRLKERE